MVFLIQLRKTATDNTLAVRAADCTEPRASTSGQTLYADSRNLS